MKKNAVLDSRTKRNAYHELSLERKQELEKLARGRADQKKEIHERMPNLTWDDYLVAQARQGNIEALAVLRKRQTYRKEISRALLTVETIEQARHIIKPQFRPTVRKNGTIVYRARDGSLVYDQTAAISVKEVTEAATLLALSLADERFRGKALLVEGSDEFKLQVARLSSLQGLSMRFADAQLESERQRYARERESRAHGNNGPLQQSYLGR